MGTTQTELARLLKVSPQTVNKIMHSSDVQTGALEQICEVLHLPIMFFYNELNDDVSPTAIANERVMDTDNVAKFWETKRIGEKVRGLLKSQHKKMSVLCRYVGMTDAGLRMAFNRDSCNVKVLLKIAEFFNVSVTYFLPEDRHAKEEAEKDREIFYLKGQLKAYEKAFATVLSGMKGTKDIELFAIHSAGE